MTEKLRLGIVGTGTIANIIARAIPESDNVSLGAVSSREESTATEFAERFGAPEAFGDWQEMLASDGIDAVYVAVPTFAEEEICIAAAVAGKHLLADKPFAGIESLKRITGACRSNDVAFLDATHFVHHPRTAKVKEVLKEYVGEVRALRSSFYAFIPDRSNIRFRPEMEPTGVLGDLSWYSFRAIVEYLPSGLELVGVDSRALLDSSTCGVFRAAGTLWFDGGVSSTFEAGYDVNARVMDLELLGPKGMISMDDFVLDWNMGIPEGDPDHEVGFTVRQGKVTPKDYNFVATPSDRSAKALMLDRFAYLSISGSEEERAASIDATEKTQALLDAVWEAAVAH